MIRPLARTTVHVALLAAAAATLGCAGSYREEEPAALFRQAPFEVLRLRWQRQLVQREFLDYKPQEWATAALVDGVVYVGSSGGRFDATRVSDGVVLWSVRTQGPVSSRPLVDRSLSTVFFGGDDGHLYAVDLRSGRVKWRYTTQGTINSQPVVADGILLFTSSEGRIYALDAGTGAWRWQYDREGPEGFTIQGYAGVTVRGSTAYTGFSDGMLVALKTYSGDVIWTKSLAAGKTQFMDVDVTPVLLGDLLLTASYASGVYALSADSGSVRWQYAVEGASNIVVHQRRVYFTAPRMGLVVLDLAGRLRWRQGVTHGVPSPPTVIGPYLFLGGTESGLYAASAKTGQLLQYFDPGHGISAQPAISEGFLVVLTNEGWLYAFQIMPPARG